jgi:hypothetical protein
MSIWLILPLILVAAIIYILDFIRMVELLWELVSGIAGAIWMMAKFMIRFVRRQLQSQA